MGLAIRFYVLLTCLLLPRIGLATLSPQAVSSFTIPHEWVGRLRADVIAHSCLVPSGGEIHGYTLSAQDARDLAKARLIVGINPQLEPWLAAWAKANQREDQLVWLHPDPLPTGSHVWTIPAEVKRMIGRLKAGMLKAGIDVSEDNEKQLLKEVDAVEATVRDTFLPLLPHERQFVTQHPGLEGYAKAFGLKVAGCLLESATAESADPSAKHYAELLKTIRQKKVRVILCDEGQNPAAAQQLAKDAEIPPPISLSFEYLQPRGTPGDTWASMMRLNARKLATALQQP